MHEFLLFSLIPRDRHDQVKNILSGVCGMQPVPICEQTLLYHRSLERIARQNKTKSALSTVRQRLYYEKLTRDIALQPTQSTSKPDDLATTTSPWRLRTDDVPDAGTKSVNSRSVTESLQPDLEALRGGSASSHTYITQYLSQGHRWIHAGAVVIRMTRIFTPPEGTGTLEPLDAPVPLLGECDVKDPSGVWLVQASVRVEDGNDAKLVEEGTGKLLALKRLLDGAVDLKPGDRLALDTRVKVSGVVVDTSSWGSDGVGVGPPANMST